MFHAVRFFAPAWPWLPSDPGLVLFHPHFSENFQSESRVVVIAFAANSPFQLPSSHSCWVSLNVCYWFNSFAHRQSFLNFALTPFPSKKKCSLVALALFDSAQETSEPFSFTTCRISEHGINTP